ncbi:hypothetical protein VPH35_127666 [Triticum aestivum]
MVKDKTAVLERAKKAMGAAKGKKQNRGSSSRMGLPPGWIQGDWIRSSIRQEDLVELAESGLIAKGAARLPEGEMEPQPRLDPCSLKVTATENVETKMLVEKVVQLINEGVTSLDLLEVFLSRRIQPLQARDRPMWLYSGPDDTARVHLEEVPPKTVALWLRGIRGNQDNPRGSRRVIPFGDDNQPDKVFTEMHSMPNDEQDLE